MKIIVTGGAGFIGCNFILYIMKKYPQYRIMCVDKLTYAANVDLLEELKNNDNFAFVKADICDKENMEGVFAEFEPDVLVNFAAESHVDRSIEEPGVFLRTNYVGVGVLLDLCRRYNVYFHQISTDEVYGDVDFKSDERFTEQSPLKPSSPYSASKAAADMLVMAYCKTYGLPVTISRSSNNYGMYQNSEKLIPHLIEAALSGQKLPVYGDGSNVREWLYVEDHCRAVDMIIHSESKGEIFNTGSGFSCSNNTIAEKICEILGISKMRIEYVCDRKGHDRKYATDCTKIQRLLGWREEADFEQTFRMTVERYARMMKR